MTDEPNEPAVEEEPSPFVNLSKVKQDNVECALLYVQGQGLVLLTPELLNSNSPSIEVFAALMIIMTEHPEYAVELSAWIQNTDPDKVIKYVNLPHLPIQEEDDD